MFLLVFVLKTRDIRMRLLIAYCAVPLHCRQTHECLDASAQGGGKDLHVLGSVPEPAGDGPPGAAMSGDRGGGGTGWGRRQSRYLADGAAASAAAFAVYVNSAEGGEDAKAGHAAATAPLIASMLLVIVAVPINAGQRRSIKW